MKGNIVAEEIRGRIPSFAENVEDWLVKRGMGRRQARGIGQFGQMVPGLGDVEDVRDVAAGLKTGDYGRVGMGAVGAVPVIGGVLKKGLGSVIRNMPNALESLRLRRGARSKLEKLQKKHGDLVTGDDGKPLVVYHGTPKMGQFDEFDVTKSDDPSNKFIAFSTDPVFSENYTRHFGEANEGSPGMLMGVLKGKNIFDFRNKDHVKRLERKLINGKHAQLDRFKKILKKRGTDEEYAAKLVKDGRSNIEDSMAMARSWRDTIENSIVRVTDDLENLKTYRGMSGIHDGRWSAVEGAQAEIKELGYDGFLTSEFRTNPGVPKILKSGSEESRSLNVNVWKDEQFVPLFDDMKFGPGTEIKPVDALSRIKRTDVFTTSAERTKELRRKAMGIGTGDSQDEKALIAAERMLDILRK